LAQAAPLAWLLAFFTFPRSLSSTSAARDLEMGGRAEKRSSAAGQGNDGHVAQSLSAIEAAILMLRTGPKLGGPKTEELILELSPGGRSYEATQEPEPSTDDDLLSSCSSDSFSQDSDAEMSDSLARETEWMLEGYCPDEDPLTESPSEKLEQVEIQQWGPGSKAPKRLMEARSRQCIICFTEKQHTFVPPHCHDQHGSPAHSAQVESHRFCTDCWAQFLRHQLRGSGGAGLSCPLCRCPIDIPDMWKVVFDLPQPRSRLYPEQAEEDVPLASIWARKRAFVIGGELIIAGPGGGVGSRRRHRPSYGAEDDILEASDSASSCPPPSARSVSEPPPPPKQQLQLQLAAPATEEKPVERAGGGGGGVSGMSRVTSMFARMFFLISICPWWSIMGLMAFFHSAASWGRSG